MLIAIANSLGCNSTTTASQHPMATDRREVYGQTLNNLSSPTRIAEIALLAIRKNDMETLAKLIASESVKANVSYITHGGSQFKKWGD